MSAVKVIGVDVLEDEHELGVCNQGVTMEGLVMRDVASGYTVAAWGGANWCGPNGRGSYMRVFVQAMPSPLEEIEKLKEGCGLFRRGNGVCGVGGLCDWCGPKLNKAITIHRGGS